MFYEEIFRELNKRNVRYLVVGGIAVNLYGVPRVTQDLDLLVDMGEENLKRLVEGLQELGYIPRVPVKAEDFIKPAMRKKWIKEKNMKVFSFFHSKIPVQEVDILISSPIKYEEAEKRKVVKRAGDITIPLVSIYDLMKMKEKVGRRQDVSDINMLKKVLELEDEEEGR